MGRLLGIVMPIRPGTEDYDTKVWHTENGFLMRLNKVSLVE
jgi:hypothetical protein